MDTVFTGRIWKLPDDVDTDTIIPGRYGVLPSAEEMSRHCLEPLRPELAAAARNELDVVDQRAQRDVADRQRVARLDVRALAADHGVAGLQVDRRQDVALLAVGVVEQRDERGAVRIVLDAGNLGRDAVLVALEVDHAVLDLVAAALMANGDLALLIAAGILLLAFQKGLFRRRLGDFLEGEHRHETSGRGSRLINTNSHFC